MKRNIKAIDFFCGAGGLTYGMSQAGIKVFAGVDIESSCKKTYETNNDAIFIEKSIVDITAKEIKQLFNNNLNRNDYTMIMGCAPCQPYSRINTRKNKNDNRKTLLDEFRRIINSVKPHFVVMENVSGLNNDNPYFAAFLKMLEKNNYKYQFKTLNAKDFGVAQNRKRLFLIASRIKKINISFSLLKEELPVTLRDVIYGLEKITHIKPSKVDQLHKSGRLTDKSMIRMKATPKNGGLRNAWDDSLQLNCHKNKSVFLDNYGRLCWDELSSTITTKFNQYSCGRFGHPEQDRALSLREGALIQTFPKNYMFYGISEQIARQIGNAVPVNLARAVGNIFSKALKN